MKENAPHLPNNDGYIYIHADVKGKVIRVKIECIIYVEAAMNYIVIHTDDGKKQMPHHTLGRMEARLYGYTFSRVHKSYIVNDDKIIAITGHTVTLDNNIIVPLGKIYKGAFLKKIRQKL